MSRKPPLYNFPLIGWLFYSASLNWIMKGIITIRDIKQGKRGKLKIFELVLVPYYFFYGIMATMAVWGGITGLMAFFIAAIFGLKFEAGGLYVLNTFTFIGLCLAIITGIRTYKWMTQQSTEKQVPA